MKRAGLPVRPVVVPILGSSPRLYSSISLPPHREMKAGFLFASLPCAVIFLVLILLHSCVQRAHKFRFGSCDGREIFICCDASSSAKNA